MNARFVRGVDPMDSMQLGKFHERQLEKAKEELKQIFDAIKTKYGGKTRVYKSVSSMGTNIQATWIPETSPYNYGIQFDKEDEEYYFTPFKWNKPGEPFANQYYGGRKSAREAANEMVAQWGGQQLVDQWGKTNESVNFERGVEPKRAMNIGKNKNNFFAEIQSMPFIEACETFPWFEKLFGGDANQLVSAAAVMLGVPENKVRVATEIDDEEMYRPLSPGDKEIDDMIERDEWNYDKEDAVGFCQLIGSSTGEIYIKNQNTEDILAVLGTIY